VLSDQFAIPAVSAIPDPDDIRPADRDDHEWIVDPTDVRPRDWVEDEFVSDPDAFQPASWDVRLRGHHQ
jgi:hypothetical protein